MSRKSSVLLAEVIAPTSPFSFNVEYCPFFKLPGRPRILLYKTIINMNFRLFCSVPFHCYGFHIKIPNVEEMVIHSPIAIGHNYMHPWVAILNVKDSNSVHYIGISKVD